jgi:hypothetical protein
VLGYRCAAGQSNERKVDGDDYTYNEELDVRDVLRPANPIARAATSKKIIRTVVSCKLWADVLRQPAS